MIARRQCSLRIIVLPALAGLAATLSLLAQQEPGGTLGGVVEAVSSEGHVFPVQGASIQVAGTGANARSFTASTSENGAYTIENLPQGEYTLTASPPVSRAPVSSSPFKRARPRSRTSGWKSKCYISRSKCAPPPQ